jgi:hypothetical protein
MKKSIPWAIVVVAVVALMASCASAPPQKPAVAAPEAELAKAKDLQKEVDTYSLGDYAPDEYAAAVNDLKAGEDAYGKDNAASKQSLDKAIAGFNTVIDKAGPMYLSKLRDGTAASKKAADDLKSSVAVKDDYAKAQGVYDRALKEDSAKDMANASKDYAQARDMFNAVTEKARAKRDKAEQAIKETDQSQAASEEKATDADKALEQEGFSPAGSGQ